MPVSDPPTAFAILFIQFVHVKFINKLLRQSVKRAGKALSPGSFLRFFAWRLLSAIPRECDDPLFVLSRILHVFAVTFIHRFFFRIVCCVHHRQESFRLSSEGGPGFQRVFFDLFLQEFLQVLVLSNGSSVLCIQFRKLDMRLCADPFVFQMLQAHFLHFIIQGERKRKKGIPVQDADTPCKCFPVCFHLSPPLNCFSLPVYGIIHQVSAGSPAFLSLKPCFPLSVHGSGHLFLQ